MNLQIVREIAIFFILMLGQVLVFNHIHLFNLATPLLYIYVVLRFPRGISRSLGLIQPQLLLLFIQRDNTDEFIPSIATLGTARFIYYTLMMVLIYCLCFFTLESFNFFNWLQWIENVGGSMAITSVLIITIEMFRSR